MPATYSIDPSRRLVLCRAWGAFTDSDLREFYRTLLKETTFDPYFCQLGDLLEVTDIRLSTATIRDVARMRVFRPGSKRAFVVGTDAMYGLARMYKSYSLSSRDEDITIFRDLAEARRWLGIEGGVSGRH